MAQYPAAQSTTDLSADKASEADNGGMTEAVRKTVRDAADRGTALAGETLETGRKYVGQVREAGQDYAEQAAQKADELYRAGQQKSQEAAFYAELGYEEATNMVRRNPVQSVGIAVGIGFLMGLVIARR